MYEGYQPRDNPLVLDVSLILRAVRDPKRVALFLASRVYNVIVDLDRQPEPPATSLRELQEVREHARRRTDISDHLPVMFVEALAAKPKLIVELGVRGGDSTFVFERVARLSGATLVSVDIDDCSRVSTYESWHFVREDDVTFAGRFQAWCRDQGIDPSIDVLFIDTSHLYEHTKREIAAWFPFLSDTARVFLHDTNLKLVLRRGDGTLTLGWDNQRGVIRA
ncbi:MAG TPA: class I SAM-dependent methyltransferase, partial [Dehalococcoidia bacterium]|nr:class I SAM-dependent methyltransferase [Dehalococcoidia bacterium]